MIIILILVFIMNFHKKNLNDLNSNLIFNENLMDERTFIFNQVHQITQDKDYCYAFNGESLVFSLKPSLDSTANLDISSSNKIKCIFLCIIKKQIIFPLLLGNSQSSSDTILKPSSGNDCSNSSDLSFTSALAITNDSSNVIIGRSDGSVAILNLNSFLETHLNNSNQEGSNSIEKKEYNKRIELPSNSYTNYKFIHKNEITNMSFLKGNKRVIIGDKTGMITLLSFVNSFTCELVVQTTIINLKMPYILFEVYPEDNIFAFASSRGFSVLRAGRRIEVLLCNEEEVPNAEICCSIDNFTDDSEINSSISVDDNSSKNECKKNPKNRILVCKNRSIFVFDIEIAEDRKIDQWTFELPNNNNSKKSNPIIRCFIINHFYFLLLFKDGDAVIIQDKSGEIVMNITDLPTNVNPSRIQFVNNDLIYFLKSDIVQKTVDFPLE